MNSMIDLFLNHEPQVTDLSLKIMDVLPDLLSESVLTNDELLDLAQVLADKGNYTLS
jgi:hypothetical protein